MRSSLILTTLATLLAALALAVPAAAAPADFDTTFDGDGIRTESYVISDHGARATAFQSSGKTIVAGARNVFVAQNDFWIARYNDDGTPDATFGDGTDGDIAVDIAGGFDYVRDIAVLPDDSILAVGNSQESGESRFSVVKLDANGDLDATFGGGDGKVTADVGFDWSYGFAIDTYAPTSITNAGKFIVAGQADGNNTATVDNDFALARFNANGTLDTTFGQSSSGWNTQSLEVSNNELAVAVSIDDATEKIIAAGQTQVGIDVYMAVARFTTVGFVDTTFDVAGPTDGHTTVPLMALAADIPEEAVMQSDGKMVVVGETIVNDGTKDFAVARVNADGGMDTSFAGDGTTTVDFYSDHDKAKDVAIDADGKLIIAGEASNGTDLEDAIARLNSDGTPDANFGTGGKFTTNPGGFEDGLQSVAVRPSDGKIVAAGFNVNDFNNHFPLVLRLAGGTGSPPAPPVIPSPMTLDQTFDGDGKVFTDTSPLDGDLVRAVATQTDRKTVAAGYTTTLTGGVDMLVARYNIDGSLDGGFGGGDGIAVIESQLAAQDQANAVAIQSDGKIVVAGFTDVGGANHDAMIARFNVDGTPDGGFGTGGVTVSDLSVAWNEINAIAIQPTGEIVAAGFRTIGSDRQAIIGRYTSAGSPDNTFDTDGLATLGLPGFFDYADAVAVQGDGKIVIAGTGAESGNRNVYLARVDSGGTLDNGFSGDGRLTFPIGTGTDVARGLALDSDGRAVITGTTTTSDDEDFFVARIDDTDGELDTAFGGGDGIVTTEFENDADEESYDLLVMPDGRIVAGGFTTYGTDRDFALARYNTDGSPDTTFDTDGKGSTPMGSDNDRAFGLTQMSDGRVIAGGQTSSADGLDVALIRLGEAPPALPLTPPPAEAAAAARITSPRNNRKYSRKRLLKIRGNATGIGSEVVKVELALRREYKGKCLWLKSSRAKYRKSRRRGDCPKSTWLKTTGTTSWSYSFKRKLPRGTYRLYARAILADGTVQSKFTSAENAVKFKIR